MKEIHTTWIESRSEAAALRKAQELEERGYINVTRSNGKSVKMLRGRMTKGHHDEPEFPEEKTPENSHMFSFWSINMELPPGVRDDNYESFIWAK